MQERLQKIIAQAGICSRREAEQLITEGRVTINGKIADQLGVKADKSSDHIKVDGKLLKVQDSHRYLLVNKPKGVITSVTDPEGRTTIMDVLKGIDARVYPVGRLDFQTEGAILLTNDGDLANRLLSPKSKCPKTYLVKVFGLPDEKDLSRVQRGVTIDGTRYGSCKVEVLRPGNNSWLKVILHEGKNQQIKRVFEFIGHPVSKLKRIGFAFLTSKGLKSGAWRELREVEVERLKRGDYQPLVPIDPTPFLKEFGVPLPKYSPKQRKDGRRPVAERSRHGHSDAKRSRGPMGKGRESTSDERRSSRPRFDKESGDDRRSGGRSSGSGPRKTSDRRRQETRSDERRPSRSGFDSENQRERRPSRPGSDRRDRPTRGQGSGSVNDGKRTSRPRFEKDPRSRNQGQSSAGGPESRSPSGYRKSDPRHSDGPKSSSSRGHKSKPGNKSSAKSPTGKKSGGFGPKPRAAKASGKGRTSGSRFPMNKGKR